MEKLKVALLYRGQTRMFKQGIEWLNRLKERHKYDIDIMTFGHTSAIETIAYSDENVDVSKINFRQCRKLKIDDVKDRLMQFEMKNFRIFNPPHVYCQAKEIIDYWLENVEFRQFLERAGGDNHFIRKFLISNYDPKLFIIAKLYAQRDLYYASQIEIGDFISQYLSAGHSFQMLDYWGERNNWKPDIVLSLRYDTAFDIHNIYELHEAVNGTKKVLGNGLIIKNQTGRVDDLLFAMDYETSKDFLGDIDNRIYQLLTDWRVLTSLSSFDQVAVPHIFWSYLIKHDLELINTDLFKSAVMRPGVDKEYDLRTVEIHKIHDHFKKWNADLNRKLSAVSPEMRHGVFNIEYALDMLEQKIEDVFK